MRRRHVATVICVVNKDINLTNSTSYIGLLTDWNITWIIISHNFFFITPEIIGFDSLDWESSKLLLIKCSMYHRATALTRRSSNTSNPSNKCNDQLFPLWNQSWFLVLLLIGLMTGMNGLLTILYAHLPIKAPTPPHRLVPQANEGGNNYTRRGRRRIRGQKVSRSIDRKSRQILKDSSSPPPAL